MDSIPRRHHHVWRHYLAGWADQAGQLVCKQGGKTFKVNPRNIAVEKDFYKLRKLTEFDRAFIKRQIELYPPEARKSLENFLLLFSIEDRIRGYAELNGDREHAEQVVADEMLTVEESYHADLEQETVATLTVLREGSADALNVDGIEVRKFCYFLAVQMLRTKALKARVVPTQDPRLSENSWNVMSHIYAAGLGLSLYKTVASSPIRLLRNETDRLFIAGDHPVVSLKGAPFGADGAGFFSIYYPISPCLAVFIDDLEQPLRLHESALDDRQVTVLNQQVARMAFAQLFAQTVRCLDGLESTP